LAARERTPDQRTHPVLLHGRKHLAFDPTVQDRVRRLLGPEPLEPATFGDPVRLDDLARRGTRRTDRADLPAADQVGQRRQRLLDVRLRIRAVHLEDVDVVGLQPAQ
jgi:hypothetical protein